MANKGVRTTAQKNVKQQEAIQTGKGINTSATKTNLKTAIIESANNTKATNPTPSMNSTSSLGIPYNTTTGSNFQSKAVATDNGMNVSLPTGKGINTTPSMNNNEKGYLPNTVGANYKGKGVNTDAGKILNPTNSISKGINTDAGKLLNPTDVVGKGVASDTGMNNNPAPSFLESVLDAYSEGVGNLGQEVNNGNMTNGLINLASRLRDTEDMANLLPGSLTGAVLNNFLDSQIKGASTSDNRGRNTSRRIQGMNKYDTSEDYEGKVNGSERMRNLIDQSPRTEAMSAWERLLSLINPDMVKGNAEGSQRTQGTGTGLADAFRAINGYDSRSKGGNTGGSNYTGGNIGGNNYGGGNGGGGRSTGRGGSGSIGLAEGLGGLDLSALYDLFNSRLNEYDNNYNSLMDALMEMYGANSSSLEDSYAQLLNALGLNYSDSEGLLRSQYENSQAELEESRRRQLQEAYISRMMQQKNLADQLDALGLTGGASETLLGSLLNNYANNRASVEDSIRTSLRDLLNNYMTNQSNARQKYNESLINAQQKQLNARQDLLNNLYNAQTNALNTRANMRDDAYNDLYNTLASLVAKGYQI